MQRKTVKSALFATVSAIALASAGAASAAVVTQSIAPITFDGANDFTNNFRVTYNNLPAQVFQSTNPTTGPNYLKVISPGGGFVTSMVYDSNGASAGTSEFDAPMTVSFGARTVSATSGNSFGIYFVAPANETLLKALGVVINPDYSGTKEQVRFFRAGQVSQANAGTMEGTADISTDFGLGLNQTGFASLNITYEVVGANAGRITLSAGGKSLSHDFAAQSAVGAAEATLRLYAGTTNSEVNVTNFAVTVPEPATAALSGLVLLTMRRRRAS